MGADAVVLQVVPVVKGNAPAAVRHVGQPTVNPEPSTRYPGVPDVVSGEENVGDEVATLLILVALESK